jgi:hypothetical protein
MVIGVCVIALVAAFFVVGAWRSKRSVRQREREATADWLPHRIELHPIFLRRPAPRPRSLRSRGVSGQSARDREQETTRNMLS